MKKFLMNLGIVITVTTFIWNRIVFPLSDKMNIFLGILAVILITTSLLMKECESVNGGGYVAFGLVIVGTVVLVFAATLIIGYGVSRWLG